MAMAIATACVISPDGKYVIRKIVGEMGAELALKYNVETQAFGRERGINKYLIDVTECRNTDSPLHNYDFAYNDLPDNPDADRSSMIALLVDPEDHSHDFVETVCRNAGYDYTIFRDRDEAIRHLVKE